MRTLAEQVALLFASIEERIGEARDAVRDAYQPEASCDPDFVLQALGKLRCAVLSLRELREAVGFALPENADSIITTAVEGGGS